MRRTPQPFIFVTFSSCFLIFSNSSAITDGGAVLSLYGRKSMVVISETIFSPYEYVALIEKYLRRGRLICLVTQHDEPLSQSEDHFSAWRKLLDRLLKY